MKTCTKCVYTEETPGISFDGEGVCSYCEIHDGFEKQYTTDGMKLKELIAKVKKDGEGKKFDCVVGFSGGCDSSSLINYCIEWGLRPLAVHLDNGWNTDVSLRNTEKVLKKLNVPLWTYKVDEKVFDAMAKSFLDASVPEIDAISDVALTTAHYMAAKEHGIKHIFSGHSFRTEGITPMDWFYFDGAYVADVHKKFGNGEMGNYPNLWLETWLEFLDLGIERHRPLYFVNYDKEEAKKKLKEKFGWEWYDGHHRENRYTELCDNYILPMKFGIDLRLVEYGALIRSGQMTRETALEELESPPPFDPNIIGEAKKRLGYSDAEWTEMMMKEKKTHKDFKTYRPLFRLLKPFFQEMYARKRIPRSFLVKYTE